MFESYVVYSEFRACLNQKLNSLLDNADLIYHHGRLEIIPCDRMTLGQLYEYHEALKYAANQTSCSVLIRSSYTNDFLI